MNSKQRRKNRRKGIFTTKDKNAADCLCQTLHKLDLSDEHAVFNKNRFWWSFGIVDMQGEALKVEDLEAAMKSVVFNFGKPDVMFI